VLEDISLEACMLSHHFNDKTKRIKYQLNNLRCCCGLISKHAWHVLQEQNMKTIEQFTLSICCTHDKKSSLDIPLHCTLQPGGKLSLQDLAATSFQADYLCCCWKVDFWLSGSFRSHILLTCLRKVVCSCGLWLHALNVSSFVQ
jgi:hypothetical protein